MPGKHRAPKPPFKVPTRLTAGSVLLAAAAGPVLTGTTPAAAAPLPVRSSPHPADVPQPGVGNYTVVAGDWLSKIAPLVGETWQTLYAENQATIGADPNLIYPGQVLVTHGIAAPTPPPPAPAQHASAYQAPLRHMDVTQAFKGSAHQGVDLAASIGTPGYAVCSGTVRFSRPASGFGLWTVITCQVDGGQVDLVYGHMDHLLVAEGDHVNVGDHIIDTGTNGIVTGPHLHFEVWIGGRTAGYPVDPIQWLGDHGVAVG